MKSANSLRLLKSLTSSRRPSFKITNDSFSARAIWSGTRQISFRKSLGKMNELLQQALFCCFQMAPQSYQWILSLGLGEIDHWSLETWDQISCSFIEVQRPIGNVLSALKQTAAIARRVQHSVSLGNLHAYVTVSSWPRQDKCPTLRNPMMVSESLVSAAQQCLPHIVPQQPQHSIQLRGQPQSNVSPAAWSLHQELDDWWIWPALGTKCQSMLHLCIQILQVP